MELQGAEFACYKLNVYFTFSLHVWVLLNTENYRKQPKTNLSQIPKTIKTTENYSRLVPLDAGMHRKVPKYTDIDKIRINMHS